MAASGGITDCESVTIYHKKNSVLGERFKVLQVCKEILSTENVTFLLSLPLNFLVLLVLDTPEVRGSPIGSILGFFAAEPLSSSCLTSVEPEASNCE